MSKPAVFQKLQAWQDREGVSDTELADRIGVHQTAISRAKRGERALSMKHQLKLQHETKIPPSEWAEWFAQTLHLRVKDEAPAAKKQGAAKKARRPFAQSAAEVA